jgi:hypothetical protein
MLVTVLPDVGMISAAPENHPRVLQVHQQVLAGTR